MASGGGMILIGGRPLRQGRAGKPEGEELLLKVVKRQQTPAIVKGTAIQLLSQYATPRVIEAFDQALKSDQAMVRLGAVATLPLEPYALTERLAPLLSDPSRAVRVATVRRLSSYPGLPLSDDQRQAFDRAMTEYKTQLRLHPELPLSHVAMAALAQNRGDAAAGEQALRTAIRIAPYQSGLRSQLAMLLADTGGDATEIVELRREELALYERDIEMLPQLASPRAQLGVLHYYLGELNHAETRLLEASELAPDNLDYWLALVDVQIMRYRQSRDDAVYQRALTSLEQVHRLDPSSPMAPQLLQQLRAIRGASQPPPSTVE
jgi:tetratricopeptide (TPR) repeat protein